MKHTRRDLARSGMGLIATAVTARAAAQTAKPALSVLTSKTYPFDQLPTRANGPNRGRKVLEGVTHGGFHVESHITELALDQMPHPPHHHVHEEIMMLREGTLEVNLAGKKSIVTAGSVTFVGSNDEHSWKNVGDTRAIYFIVELRGE